jgi:hypothetical protein
MSVIVVEQSESVIEVVSVNNKVIELGTDDERVIVVSGDQGPVGAATLLHEDLTDVSSDQHHAQTHTILSHDTDTTGAELTELAGGSDTSLHNHDSRYYTETEIGDNYVPYTGANSDVTLGAYDLTATELTALTSVDSPILTNSLGDLNINASSGNDIIVKLGSADVNSGLLVNDSSGSNLLSLDGVGKIACTSALNTGSTAFNVASTFSPPGASELQIAIGGSAIIEGTSWSSNFVYGLSFYPFTTSTFLASTAIGSASLSITGASVTGLLNLFASPTAAFVLGLEVLPINSTAGVATTVTIPEVTGVLIRDGIVGGGVNAITNQTLLKIAKPTIGQTTNYQVILLGTGTGTGIFFGDVDGDYTRIYQSDADDLHIFCGTDKTLVLDEEVYIDVLPYSVNSGTGGQAVTSEQFGSTSFDFFFYDYSATNEELQLFFQLPHGYKEGGDFELHLHGVPETDPVTGTGDVIGFEYTYQWVNVEEDFDTSASSFTTVEKTLTAGEINEDIIIPIATLDGSPGAGDRKISSDLIVILRRRSSVATRPTNPYTGKMYVRFIDGHVPKVRMGSRTPIAA